MFTRLRYSYYTTTSFIPPPSPLYPSHKPHHSRYQSLPQYPFYFPFPLHPSYAPHLPCIIPHFPYYLPAYPLPLLYPHHPAHHPQPPHHPPYSHPPPSPIHLSNPLHVLDSDDLAHLLPILHFMIRILRIAPCPLPSYPFYPLPHFTY